MIREFRDAKHEDNYLHVSSKIEKNKAYQRLAEEETKNLRVELKREEEDEK